MNHRVGLIFLDSLTHCHTLVGNKQHWTLTAWTWCSLVPSSRGRGQLGTRLCMIHCHHDVICFHALESACVLVETIASVWCIVLSAWSVNGGCLLSCHRTIDVSNATLTYQVENLSKNQFEICTPGRMYYLQASSREAMFFWLEALQVWSLKAVSAPTQCLLVPVSALSLLVHLPNVC